MPNKIDYDRGIIKRIHPTGAEIYMYKDTPGIYLNAFGSVINETLAEEAGMNVDKYRIARRKLEMTAKAIDAIERELSSDEAGQRVIVSDRGGFNLINIGLGRHILEDPDGNNLTPNPLTLEEGQLLFDNMAPLPMPTEPEIVPDRGPDNAAPVSKVKVMTAADVISDADATIKS